MTKQDIKELEQAAAVHQVSAWSPQQVEVLRRFYGRVDMRLLAGKLGKTIVSMQSKARRIGIKAVRDV